MALQGKLESLLYIYVPNRLPPTKFDWYIPRDHARPAKTFPHVKLQQLLLGGITFNCIK